MSVIDYLFLLFTLSFNFFSISCFRFQTSWWRGLSGVVRLAGMYVWCGAALRGMAGVARRDVM